ncbi:MAG TPA: ChuX/HutX family heme-like substrate-binding protein [Kofleriaceae bacterium]|nr:ChuX/HutX family heme-like substrate-binding protein [Kofleriaceae bacterium]
MTAGGELAARWAALRAERSDLRIRDAAAELGVSELELLATTVGTTATWLDRDMPALIHGLTEVGRCMALTRGEHAVSEVRGRYGGVELGPHAGQVVGEHVDLRVFLEHWRHALAIDEPEPRSGGRRRSIQVFDAAGVAVHKVYLEADGGDVAAWDRLCAARAGTAPGELAVEPAPPRAPERPDAEVDAAALCADWDAMTDTHEFFFLLRKHRVARTQALRMAGRERAREVRGDAMAQVLGDAAETGDRIMIFVGNRGCLQVFSGAVERIKRMGPWLNVLDPGFNLHLREDRIASSWVVHKPTRSGVVRSLELYDAAGDTIALVFRKRDDRDLAEDPSWSAVLDRLTEAR